MTIVKVASLFPPFASAAVVTPPPPPPPAESPASGYFVMFDPADPDNRRLRGKVTTPAE